jgi:peptide deformylase
MEELKAISEDSVYNTVADEGAVKKMRLVPSEEIEGIFCDDVKEEEIAEIFEIAGEMVKFCHEKSGIGLAAPQIGVNKKFFVWLDGTDKWQLAINPTFFPDNKNKTVDLLERCLSYPGRYFKVKRYKKITAVFYNIDGKTGKLKKFSRQLSGDRSWVFQHETGHLFGKTVNTEGIDMTNIVNKPSLIKESEES